MPNARTDVWTHRIVVTGLSLSVLLCAVGIIALTITNHEPPAALLALGYTALGALTGTLASAIHQPPVVSSPSSASSWEQREEPRDSSNNTTRESSSSSGS